MSVWQPPQPAEAKTASPAAGSPSASPPASVVVPGLSPVSVAAGLRRVPLLFLAGEEDDAGHRQDEEERRDGDEGAEPVSRKVGVAPREVERREDGKDDEEPGKEPEAQLPLVRDP